MLELSARVGDTAVHGRAGIPQGPLPWPPKGRPGPLCPPPPPPQVVGKVEHLQPAEPALVWVKRGLKDAPSRWRWVGGSRTQGVLKQGKEPPFAFKNTLELIKNT